MRRSASLSTRPTGLNPSTARTESSLPKPRSHTLDTAFAEDDRPWIEADPQGMLVVLLRRIAYTLLALFRAASRSDEGPAIRWRALLAWVRDALVAATEDQLADLREIAAATR